MSFSYDMEGFDGVGASLSIFGSLTFEQMAKKALNEVRPEVESATKTALRESVHHSGESEMVNSVKSFDPTMTRDGEGARLACMPTGKSSSGNRYNTKSHGRTTSKAVNNNDKAFWLEYGNVHQAARPWRDRAYGNIEKLADKIENTVAKELGAD
ncbi:MAG: hypothetical protein J6Z05_03305 [Lachnospiraceae bacterium]|nr:hypothetical protein [Lachnospiraceae bacterium]